MPTPRDPNRPADHVLALLARRLDEKGDFPATSLSISRILAAMQKDDADDSELVEAVLSDFALTQKVLRLANSAMYSSFGGSITTVSKALFVLGTETVGHLAIGLTLLESLGGAAHTEAARLELFKSILAGAVAREVAKLATRRAGEEEAVAALLRELGRMLVVFYLPELHERIAAAVPQAGEDQAAQHVLGMGLHDLGRRMAERMGLPADLVQMIEPVRAHAAPKSHLDWVRAVSEYATCHVAAMTREASEAELHDIAARYSTSTGLSAGELRAGALSAWQKDDCRALMRAITLSSRELPQAACKPRDASRRLAVGVAEMRSMAGTLAAQSAARMAVEILFQSMGFRRALFFLRRPAARVFEVRLGFGESVQPLLQSLAFEEAFSPDVFHLALANDTPVFVADSGEPNIARRLPGWFREHFPTTKSFLLIPVLVNRRPAGLAYADWDANPHGHAINAEDMVSLNALRVQLVEAFETHGRGPSDRSAGHEAAATAR